MIAALHQDYVEERVFSIGEIENAAAVLLPASNWRYVRDLTGEFRATTPFGSY